MSYWEFWFCTRTKCHLDSQSNGSYRLGNTADDNAKINTCMCAHTHMHTHTHPQPPLVTTTTHPPIPTNPPIHTHTYIHPHTQICPPTHTHTLPPMHAHTHRPTPTPHSRQCPYPEACLFKTVWLQTEQIWCSVYSSVMALLKLSAMFKVSLRLKCSAPCSYCSS